MLVPSARLRVLHSTLADDTSARYLLISLLVRDCVPTTEWYIYLTKLGNSSGSGSGSNSSNSSSSTSSSSSSSSSSSGSSKDTVVVLVAAAVAAVEVVKIQ